MTCPRRFPFADRPGVALDREYLAALREQPLLPVRLAGDREALLVSEYDAVRTVLADPRFSRQAWQGGTLFARESAALALVTSDPPQHTRRRRAVQAAFTARQAELARPRIVALAEQLLDAVEAAGPPVDLIEAYTAPLTYTVICELVGVPVADVGQLRRSVDIIMSAGRFPPDAVAAAHERIYGYFFELLERKRAAPAGDLLSMLAGSADETGLTEQEIAVLGFGLMMAGGDTTSIHLGTCLYQVVRDPVLADRLRTHPEQIPAVVEELLRWVWFAGTGGQPHVALADVELAGVPVAAGQVVIPSTDAANRDRRIFDRVDEFRPDRRPNPHLGFGYGRHLCLGAPHARVELQVGLAALVRRFDRLALAVPAGELDWRDRMFLRGVWALPVTWRVAA